MKKKLRFTALILCFAMVTTLWGCSPSPTAVSVNGRNVDASELAFYLEYNRLNAENKYGYVAKDGKYDEAIIETIKQDALDQIVASELVREQCRKNKLKLYDETVDALKSDKEYLIEGQGGKAKYLEFLKENAMTDRMYDKFRENSKYYDMLFEHLVGENGEFSYTDETLRKFFGENYCKIQYIRLSSLDIDGSELSESDIKKQVDRASNILAQARATNADFTALINSYNDDDYMKENLDGIIISSLQASESAQYKDVFKLKENEVGGVYVGKDGYYILKRLSLDAGYFDKNREAIERDAREAKFNELMADWKKDANIKTTGVFENMTLGNLRSYVK